MKNLGDMMKQVQQLQSRMQELQAKLEAASATGQAGGGLVKVTLSGKGRMTDVEIDSSLLVATEKQIVEDLVVAAYEDAKSKIDQLTGEQMKQLTGGLPLPPGFQLPF